MPIRQTASPNRLYFVFTAPGVRQDEDTIACGWHSNAGPTKYSWVSPNLGCDFLGGPSTSGNPYVDALTETASHDMFEMLTDPEDGDAPGLAPPLAWYDATYAEVGDMCVFSNLAVTLNGTNFDVQSIFVKDTSNPQGGFCSSGNPQSAAIPEPTTALLVLPALLVGLHRRRSSTSTRR